MKHSVQGLTYQQGADERIITYVQVLGIVKFKQ